MSVILLELERVFAKAIQIFLRITSSYNILYTSLIRLLTCWDAYTAASLQDVCSLRCCRLMVKNSGWKMIHNLRKNPDLPESMVFPTAHSMKMPSKSVY